MLSPLAEYCVASTNFNLICGLLRCICRRRSRPTRPDLAAALRSHHHSLPCSLQLLAAAALAAPGSRYSQQPRFAAAHACLHATGRPGVACWRATVCMHSAPAAGVQACWQVRVCASVQHTHHNNLRDTRPSLAEVLCCAELPPLWELNI
jgi:hypothetical protein